MSLLTARRVKRVLISKYESDLSQELLKLFIGNPNKYCVFVIFKDGTDLTSAIKSFGKKSFVPILLNHEDEQATEDVGKLLKSLPLMDYIVNFAGAPVSKHFSKLRPIIRSVELKLQKATANQVVETFQQVPHDPCIINFASETSIGLTHIFDPDGAQTSIGTHVTTTIRNSFRKIFPTKKSADDSVPSAEARSKSLVRPARSRDPAVPSTSGSNGSGSRLRRSLSVFKRKTNTSSPATPGSLIDDIRNQVWSNENESLKKALTKLQKGSWKDWASTLRKLNSKKVKHQKKVEKDVEEQMNREKASMQAKNSELNATTLSRSSALTPATANKIVAAREQRVDKEVGRSANKRKVQEFEKLETFFKGQVEEARLKHYHRVVKAQLVCFERKTKKYHQRLKEAELKYFRYGGRV